MSRLLNNVFEKLASSHLEQAKEVMRKISDFGFRQNDVRPENFLCLHNQEYLEISVFFSFQFKVVLSGITLS